MKRNNVIFVAVLAVLLLSGASLARPTTADVIGPAYNG
jgi:hypothetical protein